MKQNKKTTTKTTKTVTATKKKPVVCSCKDEKQQISVAETRIADLTAGEDLRNAVLIVSLIINLFFLTAWVTLQVTNQYDVALINALINR